jgi:hypothetical protein
MEPGKLEQIFMFPDCAHRLTAITTIFTQKRLPEVQLFPLLEKKKITFSVI